MTGTQGRWSATPIQGVLTGHAKVQPDGRGSFAELWRDSWTAALGLRFAQANVSTSDRGVLRGLHFHERQTDLWVIAEGRAQVALVDLRPAFASGDEPSRPLRHTIDMAMGDIVLIPPLVAHGFLALDALRLVYLVTNEYDGTDEHGFAWDDPDAAVDWLRDSPTLSQRDAAAPTLADALAGIKSRR